MKGNVHTALKYFSVFIIVFFLCIVFYGKNYQEYDSFRGIKKVKHLKNKVYNLNDEECEHYDMKWWKQNYISGLFYELNSSKKTQDLKSLLVNRDEIKLINISSSNLKAIPKELFEFKNLESLDISDNPFQDLEKLMEDLSKLPNLKILVLRHCGIIKLPDNISLLSNLVGLSLDQNIKMVELNKNIGKLKNLKYLGLRRNRKLKELPKTIGDLKCLEQIVLTATSIVRIPEELSECLSLKNITANAGKIKFLPNGIGKLKNLRHLNLGSNQIISLPTSITDLEGLRYLSLGSNDIFELPKDFSNLQNLKYLSINYNRFKNFPKDVLKLKKLRNLYVHNNSFKSIPIEVADLPNLYQLLIDHEIISDKNINEIKAINPNLRIKKHDGLRRAPAKIKRKN